MTPAERRQKLEEKWPGLVADLGRAQDEKIAKKYRGLKTNQVGQYRRELDIPRFGLGSDADSVEALRQKLEKKYPGMVARFGKESDAKLAEAYKVSQQLVYRYRGKFDIGCRFPKGEQGQTELNRAFQWLCDRLPVSAESMFSERRTADLIDGRAQPSLSHFMALAVPAKIEIRIRGTSVAFVPIAGKITAGSTGATMVVQIG